MGDNKGDQVYGFSAGAQLGSRNMSASGSGDGGFSLAGTDTSFASKSADIFGNLAALEKKHETVQEALSKEDQSGLFKDDPVLDIMGQKDSRKSQSRRDERKDRRRDYGRDFQDNRDRRGDSRDKRDSGGFRIPQGRPPRSRVPEHKRNPDKFTHYNLDDTPELSERSNSAAALSFLNSLKKKDDEEMDDDEGDGKIVFRKPTAKSKEAELEKKPVAAGAGKLVMPEYVIGQKSSTKKAKPKKNIADGSKVDLGYLEDEEEDDDTKQTSGDKIEFKKVSKKGQRRRRNDDEEEEEEKRVGDGGMKRKADEEEEEEETSIVRRDRAAERRKKSRAKIYQRHQIIDSASEDEEEWQEELKKAREEESEEEKEEASVEGKGEESMEDMAVEGV